jgi:hypothetical protein
MTKGRVRTRLGTVGRTREIEPQEDYTAEAATTDTSSWAIAPPL